MQTHTRVILFAVALIAVDAAPLTTAKAAPACASLAGTWSGTISGRFKGPMKIVFDGNCNATWSMPDGRSNQCSISLQGSENFYRCSLGSRGRVDIKPRELVWRNIYSGDDYRVAVTKR